MRRKKYHITRAIVMFASATACFFCPVCLFSEENSFYHLQYLLKLANSSPEDAGPIDRIFFKHGLVYCTGRSELAVENNRAAEKMAGGDFRQAADILEKALRNSALFFPFRYNMGTCCLHLGDLRKSLLHFKKAQAVVPEYAGTYLQIGDIYLRMNRDNDAIDNYRAALKRNKKELNAYVLLGDLFFNRNQLQIAKKYYDGCLDIDPRFPNGLLGRAKIHFKLGRYYQALLLLKSIDTTVEYDKALHYYFAECAFKLRDYATASRQYGLLLQHKNDKFFLTSPVSLIERKLELSRRFIEK